MQGWAKGITKIIRVPDLGATPARVNRRTGVMEISLKHMKAMPVAHRLFVMLHEQAHVELQTTDEVKADAYAFKKYADMGYSLKESVKALTKVLNENNPEHNWRMYLSLKRAEKYDLEYNGNKKFAK
ncbi:hypothetical protein Pedsa_0876 [Pseudopedobacter saltans DSM 12145]|uniref:Uncharacterized protein n=1 Tax=Pseudopedobacter saltans (strain ATCC 51119 / DSM 12145 / JCM 21818 / CCUG 39354 / LMG 10337 / NBRC 100064 / NCIMB 13643) TaxID=762903 RepID=F0S9U2_PSESL|nr:hypothetical protein [Pseudopedobacter saltans]ADY51448.1 hypothetical protein Pedsa_0876 [Pseudopedobacter saltans DSM 12145]